MLTSRTYTCRCVSNWCLVIALLAFPLVATSKAQILTSLSGTVTDTSGAIVPGADVQVKDQATGQITSLKTDNSGQYRASDLPAGTYQITVTSQGFSTATRTVTTGVGGISSADFALQVGASSTVVDVSSNGVTSRDLLREDSSEEQGFGLYSYILFGAPPNEATRDRYLDTLRSFIDIPETSEMIKQVSRKQLNVTYLPVKGHPDPSSAPDLLQAYDYARASGLLARISCNEKQVPCGPYLGGPYIISTTKPLSEQTSLSQHFLYQDLSSVPARIVPLWVDEFMKQSSQHDFWQKRNGPQVALRLRTSIA